MYQDVSDAQGSLLMVLARHKGQRPIFFGVESKSMTREDSESDDESPQFSHYEPNVLGMIEKMGYDLTNGPGLNSAKEEEHYFDLLFRKGKPLIIINELAGGWAMCQLRSHQPLSLKGHYIISLIRHVIVGVRCQC